MSKFPKPEEEEVRVILEEHRGVICSDCVFTAQYGPKDIFTEAQAIERVRSRDALLEWYQKGDVGFDIANDPSYSTEPGCVCCGPDKKPGQVFDCGLLIFERG